MSKIALVADSTSDLSKEEIEKYNVHILPLKIVYKDREYTDGVDITPEAVYSNMKNEVPTTSLPSMGEIEDLFKKLKAEGYKEVIVVTISSGLSGTYNSIRLVSENYPDMKIEVFDSLALSLGAGALVLEAGKMISKNESFKEIVARLPKLRSNMKVFFVLETLEYLIKGGRIGKVSGSIGQFLNLKPIISINDEGIYYTYTKVRGRKKSINKIYELVKIEQDKEPVKVWVLHGGAKEEAQELYEQVKDLPNVTDIGFGNISPVAGVHTGPGLVGVGILKND